MHEINGSSFSPDGLKIKTDLENETTLIRTIGDTGLPLSLRGYGYTRFSPDGRYVASNGDDYLHLLELWRLQNCSYVKIPKPKKIPRETADGRYELLFGKYTSYFVIHDKRTGKQFELLDHNIDEDFSNQFTPDGRYAVTAGAGCINFWETKTGEWLSGYHCFYIDGSNCNVSNLQISPDHRFAVLYDGGIYQLDVNYFAGKPKLDENHALLEQKGSRKYILFRKLKTEGILNSAAFSPDGKFIITACGTEESVYSFPAGKFLFKTLYFGKGNWLTVDSKGRYDGTPAGRKLPYYVCGKNIIQPGELCDAGWQPGLAAKLMGIDKAPITALGVRELVLCGSR